MRGNAALVGIARVMAVSLTFWAFGPSLTGAEVTISRTNWVERWITNLIEIQMPNNRFVNVYQTNWVTQLRTNVVDVYATNWTMCKLTNQIEVVALWTNHVTAYRTNWTTKTLTNQMAVNLVRTNFVDLYNTNWSVLNLTNWQAVVLFKTNWITQPVTNVVQIELPSRPVAAAPAPNEVVEPLEAPAETLSPVPAAWAGPLTIEAVRTDRPPANDLVEVQLKARPTDTSCGSAANTALASGARGRGGSPLWAGSGIQAATAGWKIQGGSQTESRGRQPSAFCARHAVSDDPRGGDPAETAGKEVIPGPRHQFFLRMASALRVRSSESPACFTASASSLATGLSVLRSASARFMAASPASCWNLGALRKGLIASPAALSGTEATADNSSFLSSSRLATSTPRARP